MVSQFSWICTSSEFSQQSKQSHQMHKSRGGTQLIRCARWWGHRDLCTYLHSTIYARQDKHLYGLMRWNGSCGFFWDRVDHDRYARQDTHLYEWMRRNESLEVSFLFHKKSHSAHLGSTVALACRFWNDSAHIRNLWGSASEALIYSTIASSHSSLHVRVLPTQALCGASMRISQQWMHSWPGNVLDPW